MSTQQRVSEVRISDNKNTTNAGFYLLLGLPTMPPKTKTHQLDHEDQEPEDRDSNDIRKRPKMSTTFEPSAFSSSHGRQSMAPVPQSADLPNINFGFDDLRDRMNKFTAKFDAFIEQGRKRVLEERNQFRMNMAEIEGRKTTIVA